MKIKNLFFTIIVIITTTISAQNTELNVMTFNLRFGELASLEDIAAYISKQRPDLVALQECDWKTMRSFTSKQAGKAFINELAYHTGMFGVYGKAINYRGGYYGVGILSKYPIIKSERMLLPNPNQRNEQRVMLIAEIELPDKSSVNFISTHLEVSSAKAREKQVKFINKQIRKIKTPVILAGDMNATPISKEIKTGFSKWLDVTDTTFTFSTVKPEIKIDYIYAYPQKKFSLIKTSVDKDCMLSDHFPINSVILIKNK